LTSKVGSGASASFVTAAALALAAHAAHAAEPGAATPAKDEMFAIHAQSTFIWQGDTDFRSPYRGPNSLPPSIGRETFDATVYLGMRLWRGAEFWIDPEINQGFALGDTEGAAGFVNGEGAKVGRTHPYSKIHRAMLRQTIDLGGESQTVDADLNQFAGTQTANRIVITAGRMSVGDVFDTNQYAHDPRSDFLNWALIDTGSFDYAADAWGYSWGGAVEWYQGPWTLRAGVFDLSIRPNDVTLDPNFGQFQLIGEVERRWSVGGKAGKVAVTGWMSRGRMGTFDDAIALGEATHMTPDTGLVRHYRTRPGISMNLEQSLTSDLGLFVRAGDDDGRYESYEYTDIDETLAAGLSLGGDRWGRKDDRLAIAGVIDQISDAHQRYLADGGLGILVGDGKLPHPGPEEIVETYYKWAVTKHVALTFDVQLIGNPAYNRDRGPAPVLGARLHAEY
jgi:high affinity Mn2+ porin